MASLEISSRSWPLELACAPKNFLFSGFLDSELFLEFSVEVSDELKIYPLEIDRLWDLTEVSSLRLFAHAKPLDFETCNGPGKGIST